MSTRKTHDVVATVGGYTDGQGQAKKRYVNVGSAFTNDEGQISIKLESVPVSPEWSGWLSLYVPKEKSGGQTQPTTQQARPTGGYRKPNVPPIGATHDLDGEPIPF